MAVLTNFQDMQNLVAWRLRQRGVNFGGALNAGANDQTPPYLIQGLLNTAYTEFLSRTIDTGIFVLKVAFPTVANATAYPIRPLPNNMSNQPNPAALEVLEATYTTATGGQNAGIEYKFQLVSTTRFGAITGNYTRRQSWFGPRAYYGCRLYGRTQFDIAPGTATSGDTMQMTIVPDPANSPTSLTVAQGGPLQASSDVPAIPQQFHMALVEYAVYHGCMAVGRRDEAKDYKQNFEEYVAAAQNFGMVYNGGDPDNGVQDVYTGADFGM